MKSSIATALSVTGIIAAGAVALAANTNLLDGGVSTVKGAPALAANVVSAEALSSTTTVAGDLQTPANSGTGCVGKCGSLGATSTDSDGAPDTLMPDSTVPAAEGESTTFTIPEIGEVTVTVTNGLLTVSGVNTLDGWTYEVELSHNSAGYEVEFYNTSTGIEYKFNVALIDGRFVTSIRDTTDRPDEPRPPSDDDDAYENDDDQDEDHDGIEDHDEDEDNDHDNDESEYEDD